MSNLVNKKDSRTSMALINSLFEEFFNTGNISHFEKMGFPKGLEYSRKKGGNLSICAEVPGVKKEDLQIDIINKGKLLKIKGTRKSIIGEEIHRKYDLILPDYVDSCNCDAKLEDGILTLEFPTKEEKESEIKIKVN